MEPDTRYVAFQGRLLMLGFGSVGQATLPLLLRHIGIRPEQIRIIACASDRWSIAEQFGVRHSDQRLTRDNYDEALKPWLGEGDLLLNLSVDVASVALMEFCWRRGALYLDTCIEPWAGRYVDDACPLSDRTNYALREEVLACRRKHRAEATAIVTQGANPGLASIFVKQALLDIAADNGIAQPRPARAEDWARLAQRLDIRVIHVAERDTQVSSQRKLRDEFVNTWSVDGFVSESLQPAELGWGSHERRLPDDALPHQAGSGAAVYLKRPGAATRVRSWTPLEGPYHGFLVTHGESISIADHLTLRENGALAYRPTVHYAYHPCDDAVLSLHELAGKNWHLQTNKRILRDEIEAGIDELGVLLMGNHKGAYWYGSRLSIDAARALAPFNSATSLQVAAGVLGGIVWALRNPQRGAVEPDDIDHELVLDVARPYLGPLVGAYTDWTPLHDLGNLYDVPKDESDPWQFVNFRVS